MTTSQKRAKTMGHLRNTRAFSGVEQSQKVATSVHPEDIARVKRSFRQDQAIRKIDCKIVIRLPMNSMRVAHPVEAVLRQPGQMPK